MLYNEPSVNYNQQNNCRFDQIFDVLTTSEAELRGIPLTVPRPTAYYVDLAPGEHPFKLLAPYDQKRKSEHDNNYKISQLCSDVKFLLPSKCDETYDEIYNAIDEIKSLVFKHKKQLARCTNYDQWLTFAQHLEKLHQLVIFYSKAFKEIDVPQAK